MSHIKRIVGVKSPLLTRPRVKPAKIRRRIRSRTIVWETLEGRMLLAVSFAPDPALSGLSIVTFTEDVAGANDRLALRIGRGGVLEASFNGAWSSDLSSSAVGLQSLPLTKISRIVASLGGGADALIVDNTQGDVMPSPGGIVFDGGSGIDTVSAIGNEDMLLTPETLSAGVTSIALTSVESASLVGGNSSNRLDASLFNGPVTLFGDSGNDSLFGGPGNDLLDGGQGSESIDGGAGDDTIRGGNSGSTLSGGMGNDVLTGSNGKDLLLGGPGNDILSGGNGDDTLGGGAGDDSLTGGLGGDSIIGGDGIDTLVETGDVSFTLTDSSMTGLGPDVLVGVEQARLTGGQKANVIDSSVFTGTATLDGGGGNDQILGSAGGTLFYPAQGISGSPTFHGGHGNDVYAPVPGITVTLIDDGGNDTIDLTRYADAVTLNLRLNHGTRQTLDASGNSISLNGVFENVRGSSVGNRLILSDGGGVAYGGTGSDSIIGGTGKYTIVSGGGNDTLVGGTGNNSITGGTGNCTIISGGGNDIIFGGTGSDSILGGTGNSTIVSGGGSDTIIGGTGNESLSGGTGNCTIVSGGGNDILFGGTGNDSMTGGTGNSTILSGGGNDTIVGGTGNETLAGGTGNCTIISGGGNDILFGGTGSDSMTGGTGNCTMVSGGGKDTIIGGTGNDSIRGGTGNCTIAAGGGNDIIFGDTGVSQIDGGDGSDLIEGGSGDDVLIGGPGDDTILGYEGNDTITGDDGNDLLFGDGDALLSADGGDSILGGLGNDTIAGEEGNDTLIGGAGDDVYTFAGDTLDSDTIVEAANLDTDTLDFSAFLAPITVDLASTVAQEVSPSHLMLTLSDALGIENVIGTKFADTIYGNARANTLSGADAVSMPAGTVPDWDGRTQVVYLDFDSRTGPGEHAYTADERNAVQAKIAAVYASFHLVITQSQPVSGPYATLYFNDTPIINGVPQPGGLATEQDFRNLNLGGSAQIDVNGFLGGNGEPDATSDNYVAITATVAAHELGHLVGLQHGDSYGPIGFGIHNPPGADVYYPIYPGPDSAFETAWHLMASPASVGSTLNDAVATTFMDEREAVKVEFAERGTTVAEQAALHSSATINGAQAIAFAPLPVPNLLQRGINAFKDFAVGAIDVLGSISLDATGNSENDVYTFTAFAGQIFNAQLMSNALKRIANPIDGILRLLDSAGNVMPFYTGTTQSDDDNESRDPSIIDVKLPYDGRYYLQVDTYSPPGGPDQDTGDYELFAYTFDTGNLVDGGDVIDGRSGNDTISGGLGDDTLTAGAGVDVVSGGAGIDRLVENRPGDAILTDDFLSIGAATATLSGIEQVALTGGAGDESFDLSGWSSNATIEGGSGSDRIIALGDRDLTLSDTSLTRSGLGTVTLTSVERALLTGGAGNNRLDASTFAGSTTLIGGAGDDVLIGSAGADVIQGNDGNDTLTGNLGADSLDGGMGTDIVIESRDANMALTDGSLKIGLSETNILVSVEQAALLGGAGNNTFTMTGWSNAASLDGGAGNDRIILTADINMTLGASSLTRPIGGTITLAGIEGAILTGGAGNSLLNASNFAGAVTLSGGAGDDTLTGGAGSAVLIGGAGNDILTGGASRDILIGGLGSDVLTGGGDDDILIGGITTFDQNLATLDAILAEWTSADTYLNRIAYLTGTKTGGLNGTTLLIKGTTVLDDSRANDSLTGGLDTDWFFAFARDKAIDSDKSELVT